MNVDQKPTPNTGRRGSRFSAYFPFLFAVALVIGIYIGMRMAHQSSADDPFTSLGYTDNEFDKLNEILDYVEAQYVDSVDRNKLVEDAIQTLLQDLDPHSYYISAEELAGYQEPLEGNFDGIGVEFLIQKDTVVVVNPLVGGPSESLGILAGDRIIMVEEELIAGVDVTNRQIMKLLKGESGTKVKISVLRPGNTFSRPADYANGQVSDLIEFDITRGKIPIHSVAVAIMTEPGIGYIKVTRFSKTTYDEFLEAIAKLKEQGMEKLVLDLRGNGGGYLNAATGMVGEFLADGKLIVYTKGKSRPIDRTFNRGDGSIKDMDFAVLVNSGSASASEIVAGALQDNDRGIIVGRRTFGKGLVQEHQSLPDGSAFRLTIARYYTPTGRCIQKPYGDGINYEDDYLSRIENGELQSMDSIAMPDSLKFVTPEGKVVYGGGGIMPDVFVAIDTIGASYYLSQLSYSGLFNQWAFNYVDDNRESLSAYSTFKKFDQRWELSDQLFEDFVAYAEDQGIARDEYGVQASSEVIRLRLKALVARNVYQNEGYYPIVLRDDNIYKQAVNSLQDRP
jgi:carboxyl-terminal processing protease